MKIDRLIYIATWLAAIAFIIGFSIAAHGATPIVDAKFSGANNELKAGSTLTINGTLTLGSGSISGVQSSNASLTSLAGLTSTANTVPYFTGSNTWGTCAFTPLAQTLLGLSSSSDWRSAILPTSPVAGDILYYNGTSWTKQSLGSINGVAKLTAGVFSAATYGTGGEVVAPGLVTASGMTTTSGSLLGRTSDGIGAIEAIEIGAGLSFASGILSATTLTNPLTTLGDLMASDAGGSLTRLAAGQNGYVLTSNGPGTMPTYKAPAGGITGPISSSDNHVAIFSGTGGNVLKDSSTFSFSGSTMDSSSGGIFVPAGTKMHIGATSPITDQWAESLELNVAGRGLFKSTSSSIEPTIFLENSGTGIMGMGVKTPANGGKGIIYCSGGLEYLIWGGSNVALRLNSGNGGTGTIAFPQYPAGTATFDSNGNITSSSDARLKTVDGDFTRGLADLKKINPKLYHWNDRSGLDREHQYAGLIAQNVQQSIPEAVMANKEGILSLQDRPIIAALINATKELDERCAALEIYIGFLTVGLVLLGAWNFILLNRHHG